MTVRMGESYGHRGRQPTPRAGEWQCHTFHAYDEVGGLLELLVARLESLRFTEAEIFGIRLALEEAMVNAIKHGHANDPSKPAVLRYRLSPTTLVAEVEDQGPGFNPELVPDPLLPENLTRPSGRGLLLMRHYMSWVRFNAAGNKVTLCRQRSA